MDDHPSTNQCAQGAASCHQLCHKNADKAVPLVGVLKDILCEVAVVILFIAIESTIFSTHGEAGVMRKEGA